MPEEKEKAMGLAWQQGPLATRSVGQFLLASRLPERLLFAEPLPRRMCVRFGGQWVVESEDAVLLHEPDRHPVAFFPLDHVREGVLVAETRTTRHRELGRTAWFSVRVGDKHAQRAAWQYTDLPSTPRWYVPREDIDESALTPAEGQTFCPYKGLESRHPAGYRPRARPREVRQRSVAADAVRAPPELTHIAL